MACLNSLRQQSVSPKNFRVVIVDNHPADKSISRAREQFKKAKNFRWLTEPRSGLSRARNRGWQFAREGLVAFIDDDAIAARDWVKNILRFHREHPEIRAFGGPYFCANTRDIPDWYPRQLTEFSLGRRERRLQIGMEWLSGTNMVFSYSLLRRFGGFRTDLGMHGRHLMYGEESRLLLDIFATGIPIYYSSRLVVNHVYASKKLKLSWLLRHHFAVGRSLAIMNRYRRPFVRQLIYTGHSLVLGSWRMVSPASPLSWKSRVYYALAPFMTQAGRIYQKYIYLL